MPNDAKLGLLAGVAGVVAAAVLSFQNPQPAPPDAPQPQVARTVAPGAVPTPTVAAQPAVKPEVEARPVSRTVGEDD